MANADTPEKTIAKMSWVRTSSGLVQQKEMTTKVETVELKTKKGT
jgi:hypothetical protein